MPWIALQSSVKNWQASGSGVSRAVLCIIAMQLRLIFASALLCCASAVHAHEAIFSWTYTTDLTPQGHGEFEQWVTTRWEKEHGSYRVVDFREEFEYGVTDNFQLALYSIIITSMRTMMFRLKIRRAPADVCPAFTRPVVKTSMPDTIPLRRSTVIILNRSRWKEFIGS